MPWARRTVDGSTRTPEAGVSHRPVAPAVTTTDVTLALQRSIGNQAVVAVLESAAATIQRMDDPNGEVLIVLQKAYANFRRDNASHNLPVPSKVRPKMLSSIEDADDKADAFRRFATEVSDLFWGSGHFKTSKKEEFVKHLEKLDTSTATKRKERADDLKKLRADAQSVTVKKRKVGDEGKKVPVYTEEQQAKVKSQLGEPKMANKLFHASNLAYQKHRGRARPEAATAAKHNQVPVLGPLQTADLALVHSSYTHEQFGDSLTLEQIGENKVTMVRTGGQEIHQLGPYLPGSKTSVQELIEEILATKKVTSTELAAAVSMSSLEQTDKFLRSKGIADTYLVKVRAMRHLLAVEMSRGPETSLGTALEHRSGFHGYRHYSDYPQHTPLGPPEATTNLRKAREKSTKGKSSTPDYSYIPTETRTRGLASISFFLNSFVASPSVDSEATKLVDTFLKEPADDTMPTDDLIDACADVLRTPMYNPFEEFVEDEKETEEKIPKNEEKMEDDVRT